MLLARACLRLLALACACSRLLALACACLRLLALACACLRLRACTGMQASVRDRLRCFCCRDLLIARRLSSTAAQEARTIRARWTSGGGPSLRLVSWPPSTRMRTKRTSCEWFLRLLYCTVLCSPRISGSARHVFSVYKFQVLFLAPREGNASAIGSYPQYMYTITNYSTNNNNTYYSQGSSLYIRYRNHLTRYSIQNPA